VLCLTNRKSMSYSVCAWPQIAPNWRAMFTIVNWRRISWRVMLATVRWRFISFGWQSYGPREPNRAQTDTSVEKST